MKTRIVAVASGTLTLLDANQYRRFALLRNDSTTRLFVRLGVGARTNRRSVVLAPGQTFEFVYHCSYYTGIVTGAWEKPRRACGNAHIVEG